MRNEPPSPQFLQPSDVIDWDHPSVAAQAASLAGPGDPITTARACFEFVRDGIRHSRDYECDPVTWRASDVLRRRTGYCYAKSHLLAALLRANGLPAGFCYQRLSVNDSGPPYSLHGFNAVWLPDVGWYRVDARGNKPGVNAQFEPPVERLAFPLQAADEVEFDNILPQPLEVVLSALRSSTSWADALQRLPDVDVSQVDALGLTVRRRGPAGVRPGA
jgi:transglutaminase-like putative cysteine protease